MSVAVAQNQVVIDETRPGAAATTCEVIKAKNGSRKNLCRWRSIGSEAACKQSAGIWTAVGSRYAKNHLGAVKPGTSGACITEVKNLKNRIQ